MEIYKNDLNKHRIESIGFIRPTSPVIPHIRSKANPSIAFGAEEWKKLFGDVGVESPLPEDIEEVNKLFNTG